MKRTLIIAGGALALATAGIMSTAVFAPLAAQSTKAATARAQTAKFAVEKMSCATCPITVKKAMAGVKGVKTVKVDFDTKTAIVEFDPKVTNRAKIAAASTNAGYPAKSIR